MVLVGLFVLGAHGGGGSPVCRRTGLHECQLACKGNCTAHVHGYTCVRRFVVPLACAIGPWHDARRRSLLGSILLLLVLCSVSHHHAVLAPWCSDECNTTTVVVAHASLVVPCVRARLPCISTIAFRRYRLLRGSVEVPCFSTVLLSVTSVWYCG